MDSHATTQNPQLASILLNLAQFTRPAAQSQPRAPDNVNPNQPSTSLPPGKPDISSLAPPSQDPRRRSATPQPDSSSITEWPAAVKYVMNTLSQNQETSSKIKRLIKNQHVNERQWWAGREALVAKHENRVESTKKANDLLRSLGGMNGRAEATPSPGAEEEKAELNRYDKKVYAALGQMVAAMDRELTGLRVPFFAIKHDLVGISGGAEGMLSKVELMELQRKMLQFLEDLFGE
jgi:Protein of unknown function (DUF2458)